MEILQEIVQIYKPMWQAFQHFWWIVLPWLFYFAFMPLWMDYVIAYSKKSWLASQEWVLLEIIPPKDIEKSPKVMESIYSGISGVYVSINPIDMYMKGAIIDRFSLEIVGEEGKMHFYIRTQKKLRNLIEAQVYGQFPDAEIIEVDDYVKKFPKIIPNKEWDIWGTDVELQLPDAYPIRTYDKFEEDITGTMIDPLAAMAEVIGTLGPNQHIWLQYVIDPIAEAWRNDEMDLVKKLAGRISGPPMGVWDHLVDVLSNIPKAFSGPVEFAKTEKKEEQPLEFRLTPGEKEVLKALEENLGRNAYKIKMRLLVLGKREGFSKANVSAFFGTIKQFNDLNLNQFKPENNSKTATYYIMKKERLAQRQRKIYRRYKDRDMDGKKIILTTKELATVFHFPDIGVKAPSVTKIESKRGTAPANLPIG